jgi:hypothetical protein
MELHHIRLIGFAAGLLIVGLQTTLIAKQWHKARGQERRRIMECGLFCLTTVFWQFGNLANELLLAFGFPATSGMATTTFFVRRAALYLLPLSLSYLSPLFLPQSGVTRWPAAVGRWLRLALWPWSVFLILLHLGSAVGWIDPEDMQLAARTSVRLIAVFFGIFLLQALLQIRESTTGQSPSPKANLVAMASCLLGVAGLIAADWADNTTYVRLAVMLTLSIFTIAVAYRQYQFPFMDTFIRQATSGVLLVAILIGGLSAGFLWMRQDLLPLWVVALSVSLIYLKDPLMRWVERALMGFDEPIESQENRIGVAIRGLIDQEQFDLWVRSSLAAEMKAQWADLSSTPRRDAACVFEVPASEPLWLSFGQQIDGRPYMSRHLRIGQMTALQLAAQRERVIREEFERQQVINAHELRELTARAQISALQAQIRPHFLFNTLNVLSNLIHVDPRKAEDLTEELAAVFRYTLDATRREWVSLEDEVRFVTSYLKIEKARFEDRLSYFIDLEPGTKLVRVPPMILQPVVENAVRHGISSRIEGGFVRLTAQTSSGRLFLTIEDSGAGLKSDMSSNGIGLKNVRDRLQHIYGSEGLLELSAMKPTGTRVLLTIPEFAEARV